MSPGINRMIVPALAIGLLLTTIFYFSSIASSRPAKNVRGLMNVAEAIVYAKKNNNSNSEITVRGLFVGETKHNRNKMILLDDINGKHPGRLICEFPTLNLDLHIGRINQVELTISGVPQITDTTIILTSCQLIVINNISSEEIKFPY